MSGRADSVPRAGSPTRFPASAAASRSRCLNPCGGATGPHWPRPGRQASSPADPRNTAVAPRVSHLRIASASAVVPPRHISPPYSHPRCVALCPASNRLDDPSRSIRSAMIRRTVRTRPPASCRQPHPYSRAPADAAAPTPGRSAVHHRLPDRPKFFDRLRGAPADLEERDERYQNARLPDHEHLVGQRAPGGVRAQPSRCRSAGCAPGSSVRSGYPLQGCSATARTPCSGGRP